MNEKFKAPKLFKYASVEIRKKMKLKITELPFIYLQE